MKLFLAVICLAVLLPTYLIAQPAAREHSALSQAAATHEKLIRAAYAKLEKYNRATELLVVNGDSSKVREERVLKFELDKFHSGPIEEIRSLRLSQLYTQRSGEVLQTGPGRHSLNHGPENATYSAQWVTDEVIGPDRTLSELFQLDPAAFFDVGHYTSYEVTVSLDGKSRTYRALVLHHDMGARAVEPKPEFWDAIVDEMNRLWEEKLPPYEGVKTSTAN